MNVKRLRRDADNPTAYRARLAKWQQNITSHGARRFDVVLEADKLEELALDGPAWRTPASVVVERTDDFVARVEELGLEGVVAKRLGSTYIPGRRCTAWVKFKLRREERLAPWESLQRYPAAARDKLVQRGLRSQDPQIRAICTNLQEKG